MFFSEPAIADSCHYVAEMDSPHRSCRDECMAGAPPEAASAAAARQQLIESRLSWLRSERAKLGEAPTEQAALARWRAESARIASEIRELLREQKLWAIVQEPYVRARLRRERIDRWRLKREAEIAAKRAPPRCPVPVAPPSLSSSAPDELTSRRSRAPLPFCIAVILATRRSPLRHAHFPPSAKRSPRRRDDLLDPY